MKQFAVFSAVFLLLALFFAFPAAAESADGDGQVTVRARVAQVLSDETVSTPYSGGQIITRVLTLRVEILEGAFEGQQATVRQTFDEISLPSAYPAKAGDLLFVSLALDEQNHLTGSAADYVRDLPIALLAGAFLLFLILFGRWKGVKTVLSLAVTCFVVFGLFFPLAVRGLSPVWLSLLCAALMTGFTLFLVCGFTRKALSAILGCLGGLGAAGVLAASFSYAMRLSGIVDEEAAYLRFLSDEFVLDFKGLLFAAIIIGASGAAMDVAVSIASSLDELIQKAPGISPRHLFFSGAAIGRDIMGTMSNTLILAYVGGSIHLILLLYAYPVPFVNIINREMVAAEILIALCGSIGMLATIPLTALITALLYRRAGFAGKTPE
ncbi:MAG: YibE/F family protein [Oscillospiraceae bacterium]|nr:YibE/F family protein [Oscillospiraceae bacterium]